MANRKLVDPESGDQALLSEIREELEKLAIGPEDSKWIAKAIDSPTLPPPPLDPDEEHRDGILRRAQYAVGSAQTLSTRGDRDEVLVRILLGLLAALRSEARDVAAEAEDTDQPDAGSTRLGQSDWSMLRSEIGPGSMDAPPIRRAVRLLVDHWASAVPAIDFAHGIRGLGDWYLARESMRPLTRALHRTGVLVPADSFDVDTLLKEVRIFGHSTFGDPAFAQFWLSGLGTTGIGHLLSSLDPLDDEPFALAVERLLAAADEVPRSDWARYGRAGRNVYRPALEALQELLARIETRLDTTPRTSSLLNAAWQVAIRIEGRGTGLDSRQRASLLERAHGTLGKLRSELASASPGILPEGAGPRPYVSALLFVGWASGYERAIRSALLLLRALRSASVSSDLRYWREPGLPDPPDDLCWIPSWTTELIHLAVRYGDDGGSLTGLRKFLASHFLSRLETRKGAEAPFEDVDFVEPDPLWRQCTIRAIRELRIHPGARGFGSLKWLSSHDPDEDNRKDARVACSELGQRVLLAPGVSPRRAVLASIWWLRQAHALSTGVEVNAAGASRTRQKEGRRAKDLDREERPN